MQASRKEKIQRLIIDKAKEKYANSAIVDKIAPYSPSPMTMVMSTLQTIALTKEDFVVDLGCGDGRWVIYAAKEFGCRALGIEIQSHLVEIGRQQAEGLNVDIRLGNIWDVDLAPATLIIVYAFAESLAGIADFIESNGNVGVFVLSVGVRCLFVNFL